MGSFEDPPRMPLLTVCVGVFGCILMCGGIRQMQQQSQMQMLLQAQQQQQAQARALSLGLLPGVSLPPAPTHPHSCFYV